MGPPAAYRFWPSAFECHTASLWWSFAVAFGNFHCTGLGLKQQPRSSQSELCSKKCLPRAMEDADWSFMPHAHAERGCCRHVRICQKGRHRLMKRLHCSCGLGRSAVLMTALLNLNCISLDSSSQHACLFLWHSLHYPRMHRSMATPKSAGWCRNMSHTLVY